MDVLRAPCPSAPDLGTLGRRRSLALGDLGISTGVSGSVVAGQISRVGAANLFLCSDLGAPGHEQLDLGVAVHPERIHVF